MTCRSEARDGQHPAGVRCDEYTDKEIQINEPGGFYQQMNGFRSMGYRVVNYPTCLLSLVSNLCRASPRPALSTDPSPTPSSLHPPGALLPPSLSSSRAHKQALASLLSQAGSEERGGGGFHFSMSKLLL